MAIDEATLTNIQLRTLGARAENRSGPTSAKRYS